jgi:hypothetical protein
MGDRVQVHIVEGDRHNIWLYGHWSGDRIISDVRRALAKRWRWRDSEYLTRIIFDEMVGDSQGGELSYGIGNSQHGDVYRIVEVDCGKQKVRLVKGDSESHMKWAEEYGYSFTIRQVLWEGSFDDFVDSQVDSWYAGEE